MANASAKRTAQHNAESIKNLRLGLLVSGALSILLRLLFRRGSLSPKQLSFWIYVFSLVPSVFLSRYLERIGSPRRDPTTGTLISAGEDLSRPGIIEWCFDVIYITWACQVGSGAFGQWVWWLYLIIPLYAIFKLWSSVISPMFFGRSAAASAAPEGEGETKEPTSKRQEKLRKRSERGDPRVRMQTR
ncbi:DUF788-domain-containing protein [Cubamyces menziesii]|uniref:Opsin n=1 Tax=Trametes cubensis TaxID=1111947 RepID=A0AAD7TXE9_9APHY|nr:DUF788-domain-containing protein [Cubamyces lactineus]KAI0663108.1 DUF788-domain-containing protein [Cubamyces menziesii]KAJ8487477.1 hypothetical protein ONZ51_g4143 [Trametes cubensis]